MTIKTTNTSQHTQNMLVNNGWHWMSGFRRNWYLSGMRTILDSQLYLNQRKASFQNHLAAIGPYSQCIYMYIWLGFSNDRWSSPKVTWMPEFVNATPFEIRLDCRNAVNDFGSSYTLYAQISLVILVTANCYAVWNTCIYTGVGWKVHRLTMMQWSNFTKCCLFFNIVSPAVHTLLLVVMQRLDSHGIEALILILGKSPQQQIMTSSSVRYCFQPFFSSCWIIVRWCQIRWIWRVINQFKATVTHSSHCNHIRVCRSIVLVKHRLFR